MPRCVCKSSPWLQILCLYRSQKETNLFQHVIIHTWTKQTGYQILSTDNKWLSIHLFLENSDWLNEIEWIKYLRMLWSRKKKLMSSVKLPPGKCLLSFSQHLLSIPIKSLLQENTKMTHNLIMHFSNLAEGISIFSVGHIIIFCLEQANLKPTIAIYYLVIET